MIKLLSHATFWKKYCLLLLLSLSFNSHAESVVLQGENPTPIALGPHYQLHVDSKHSLNIDEILSPSAKVSFTSLASKNLNLGLRKETLWFKVDVSNNNAYDLKQLLEFNFSLLDELGIYIVHKESKRILSRFDADNDAALNNRLFQHSNFIFPISLPANTDLSFYFRIQSKGNMTAGATLWQPAVFAEQERHTHFLINLYLGMLIALICYSVFLFISIRDTHYLYYALFASAMLLAVGTHRGIWFDIFWPTLITWQKILSPLFFAASGLFAALFAKSFLQTESETPKLNIAFNYIAAAFLLILISSPIIDTALSLQLNAISILILSLIAITSAIILSIRGSREGQIYLIAWLGLLVGASLFAAQILGWLPSSALTRNSVIIGSTLEMLIFFFAIAQKFNLLNKENNFSRQEIFQAQNHLSNAVRDKERELLKVVKKRTESLTLANEYLQSQQEKNHDTLTGLSNVTLITEQFKLLLAQCKRKNSSLVLLLLNVNNFKHVNDEFGHEVGDKLLITLAARLRDNLRESDVTARVDSEDAAHIEGDAAARVNGDEFIVLLQVEDAHRDAENIAKKIKKAFSETALIDGYGIQVSVSIGISISPDHGDTLEELLSKATQAMYLDKGYLTVAGERIIE